MVIIAIVLGFWIISNRMEIDKLKERVEKLEKR